MNHSLRNIWNGTEDSFTKEEKEHKDFKDIKAHLSNLKETLQILIDLLNQKTSVNTVML